MSWDKFIKLICWACEWLKWNFALNILHMIFIIQFHLRGENYFTNWSLISKQNYNSQFQPQIQQLEENHISKLLLSLHRTVVFFKFSTSGTGGNNPSSICQCLMMETNLCIGTTIRAGQTQLWLLFYIFMTSQ